MSYFNHPVKVPVFKAAIPGLIERMLRKGGLQDRIIMQVLFAGDGACVVWHEYGGEIRGTVKLPELNDKAVITREKANRWVAYVIHEVWHVVFTHGPTFSGFGKQYPGLRFHLQNGIEDARIEHAGMTLGYAEGFKIVGKDLLEHMLVTGGMDVNPNEPQQIPFVFAVGCRRYGVKGERRLMTALDPRIKVLVDEAYNRVHAIPVPVQNHVGTKLSGDIALWVYEELKKIGQHRELPVLVDAPRPPVPPPPPKPPKGEKPETPEPEEGTDLSDRTEEDASKETYEEPGPRQKLFVGDKVRCPDGSKGIITAINVDTAEATVEPLTEGVEA